MSGPDGTGRPGPLTRLRQWSPADRRLWLIRTALAVVAGAGMYLAFPPVVVVPVGARTRCAVRAAVGGQTRARTGAWIGFTFGLGFFVPLLPWIGEYVGPLPWLALATVMAGYLALFGVIATITMRLPVPPVWFTLAWILVEAVRSSFPFGGFPMGPDRVQPGRRTAAAAGLDPRRTGPVRGGGSVRGRGGVVRRDHRGFPAYRAQTRDQIVPEPEAGRPDTVTWAAIAAVLTFGGTGERDPGHPDTIDRTVSTSTVNVAAIQGNVPRLGLDFNAQRRAVLDNHIAETKRLADDVQAGRAMAPTWCCGLRTPRTSHHRSIPTQHRRSKTPRSSSTRLSCWAPSCTTTADTPPTLCSSGIRTAAPPPATTSTSSSRLANTSRGAASSGSSPRTRTWPETSVPEPVPGRRCRRPWPNRPRRNLHLLGGRVRPLGTQGGPRRCRVLVRAHQQRHLRPHQHDLSATGDVPGAGGRTWPVGGGGGNERVSAIVGADGMIESKSGFFTPATLTSHLALRSDTTIATQLGGLPQTAAVVIAIAAFLFAITRRTRFSQRFPIRRMGTTSDREDSADTTSEEIDGIAR